MTDKYVSVPVELNMAINEHTITSNVAMCCAETGRVMAVFYNDYDAEMVIGLIEAAPEPASAEQWIKCSDRMPDVGQPVLVHVIYEYPIVGYITSIGWVCYATDEYIAGEPDFWMPLPQPPE